MFVFFVDEEFRFVSFLLFLCGLEDERMFSSLRFVDYDRRMYVLCEDGR